MARPTPVPEVLPVPVGRPRRRHDDRGMTTAEYAVGTVAAASFAGILIKVLTDPRVQELLIRLILWLLKTFTGMGG